MDSTKVVIVAVEQQKGASTASLHELGQLAETAGGVVVGKITETSPHVNPYYYVNDSTLAELKQMITKTKADLLITDDELTDTQHMALSTKLSIKVKDRTRILLKIFNKHEIKAQEEAERKKRFESHIPLVALVGYTNAGKTSILNALAGTTVPTDDKLFVTQDTTSCIIKLPETETKVYFTDTVGFINKLPHHLINAFQATLEEVKNADILIHVIDSSAPNQHQQMSVVYETLNKLGFSSKLIISALNKTDIANDLSGMRIDGNAYYTVPVSASTGFNIGELLMAVENLTQAQRTEIKVIIPYAESALTYKVFENCRIKKQEDRESGIYMEIFASKPMVGRLMDYRVD